MAQPDFITTVVNILLLLAGGAGLAVLVNRGFLRPGPLRNAPQRHTGLGLVELLAILSVFLLAQSLVLAVLNWSGLAPPPPPSAATTQPATSPAGTPATAPATAPPISSHAHPQGAWQTAISVILIQVLGQLPAVGLMLWVVRQRPDGWRDLGVVPRRWLAEVKLGVLCLMATIPLVMVVMAVTEWIANTLLHQEQPQYAHELLEAMGHSTALGATAVMIFSAVVVAPVLEELLFRGLVQTAILESVGWAHRWPVVLAAALVFTGIHWGAVTGPALPGLFILGLILGWLYESTGSLLPCILVHAGFNAFNTALTFAFLGRHV